MDTDIYTDLKTDLLIELRKEIGPQLRRELQNEILVKLRHSVLTDLRNEFLTSMRNEIRSEIRNEIRNELLGIKQIVPITKFRYNNPDQYDILYENMVAFNIFQMWYICHNTDYESINSAFKTLIKNEDFIEIHSNGFVETKKFLWSVDRH
jgi:hypothetical protein